MITSGTPSFAHHLSWVRTLAWPMSRSPRLRTNERVMAAQSLKVSEPIESAIDHYLSAAKGNQERAVHAMAPGPGPDLAACAEKGQFHLEAVSERPIMTSPHKKRRG